MTGDKIFGDMAAVAGAASLAGTKDMTVSGSAADAPTSIPCGITISIVLGC
ncbi:hypothetical protein [Microbacterium lacticum]|uniref:hypothetical protein n=1 Tax=Microbacterium lacticum TaxID=33885 RepID=UPI0018B03A85|nr:hypothetical protein [Microbacterium lacticum]MBF9337025.1 hypothetical protein [Microbacterium lacticum]